MGELIGKQARIIKSTSKEMIGKKGKIIDETLKTIIIQDDKKQVKTIPKKGTTFKIEEKEVNGNEIMHRPEERIKKNWRKFK